MTFRGMVRQIVVLWGVWVIGVIGIGQADAQQLGEGVLTIARGTSAVVTHPSNVARVSIGDPEIADAVVVSPREILVNARALGSTSLIIWDVNNLRRILTVEVTVDASALQRQLQALFPGENLRVTASGNMVILSGQVSDAGVAARALQIAEATGATVINNLAVPPARQILLQVRFAEISRTAATQISSQLVGTNLDDLSTVDSWTVETFSDGVMRLLLLGGTAELSALIRALQSTGEFRSLAEPNLIALEGVEASFLAGGEFPYPVPQAGVAGGGITIEYREFGVRLRFLPRITIAGNLRLRVAPEVSALDFANGLRIQGFEIPALSTRRAETEIELRDGQTFAIAGLIDQSTLRNVTRLPILGHLPIIGAFFRSRSARQDRTELLVLVTPRFIQPADVPPPLPTGEPETWRLHPHLRRPVAPPIRTP